jgi:hypothetical protein
MSRLPEEDYLYELPLPKIHYSEFMQAEMDRVAQGIDMEKTNFESKYLIEKKPESEQEIL